MNSGYLDVVRLLVRVAPVIFAEPGYALKGGTAINLFVRDLPRLSLVSNAPDWSLLNIPHLKDMPAIRWKLGNLERLQRDNKIKFAEQSAALRDRFGLVEGT